MYKDVEKRREACRRYYAKHKEQERERKRKYREEHPDKVAESHKKYRESGKKAAYNSRPEEHYKRTARHILENEVSSGRMVRPTVCSRCGCECVPQAHHTDYTEPLNVVWLCDTCHRKEHYDEEPQDN